MWGEDQQPAEGWQQVTADGESGWVPASHVQAQEISDLPLHLQAELVSRWFSSDHHLADGGTCDVYDVQLPSGRVAAKVLRQQESRMLVHAMHEESKLFNQEVTMLTSINHPNVVRILGSGVTTRDRFVIIQELLACIVLI